MKSVEILYIQKKEILINMEKMKKIVRFVLKTVDG